MTQNTEEFFDIHELSEVVSGAPNFHSPKTPLRLEIGPDPITMSPDAP
jgi:hypothetical protein